ncbi:MAG: phosphate signaling complex protein PhoU [Thermoplasmatota archaeon]|nr:phosphate signaling complex protein PhoU [Candidatus Thermoplasmatota archaeon]MBU1914260.1 phosphate signaling complex protein PhoU [Candidatus Thermoplasmatota archaeon]
MSPRKAYETELTELNRLMEKMATRTSEAIELAVRSFEKLDLDLAEKVKKIDEEMYLLNIEIEKRCLEVIALQSPVAKDLRTIGTYLKVITDFDRIGRYARDIAEVTIHAQAMAHFKPLVSIPHMAEMAERMVDRSVDAFLKRDTSPTKEVFELEDKVDSLYDEIFREVITYMMEDSKKIGLGINYTLVARYLERIADHACNISERVIYMVTGQRVVKE